MSATAMLWSAGTLIACAAMALVVWALFADRSRGRRRCPKCWYDMSRAVERDEGDSTVVLRCPECGREITHARHLARTRRRWRWALVALLLLMVATGCIITGKAKRDGWESVTPTTVLILIAQWSDDPWAVKQLGGRVLRTLGTEHSWNSPPQRVWGWQASWGLEVVMRRTFELQDRIATIGIIEVVRDIQGAGKLEQNVSRETLEAFVRAGLEHSDFMARMLTMYLVWSLAPEDLLQDEAMAAALKETGLAAQPLTGFLAEDAANSDVALGRLLTMMEHSESKATRRFALHLASRTRFEPAAAQAMVLEAVRSMASHDPDSDVRSFATFQLKRMNEAPGKPAR